MHVYKWMKGHVPFVCVSVHLCICVSVCGRGCHPANIIALERDNNLGFLTFSNQPKSIEAAAWKTDRDRVGADTLTGSASFL